MSDNLFEEPIVEQPEPRGEGFYRKNELGELDYAPNFVYHKDYELLKSLKETYNYPVGGWYWFANEAEANSLFGL